VANASMGDKLVRRTVFVEPGIYQVVVAKPQDDRRNAVADSDFELGEPSLVSGLLWLVCIIIGLCFVAFLARELSYDLYQYLIQSQWTDPGDLQRAVMHGG